LVKVECVGSTVNIVWPAEHESVGVKVNGSTAEEARVNVELLGRNSAGSNVLSGTGQTHLIVVSIQIGPSAVDTGVDGNDGLSARERIFEGQAKAVGAGQGGTVGSHASAAVGGLEGVVDGGEDRNNDGLLVCNKFVSVVLEKKKKKEEVGGGYGPGLPKVKVMLAEERQMGARVEVNCKMLLVPLNLPGKP